MFGDATPLVSTVLMSLKQLIMVSDSCRSVFFQVIFFDGTSNCDTVTNFNEGVEFAVRFNDNETWIPLAVIFRDHDDSNGITLGNLSNLVIREYPVNSQNQILVNQSVPVMNISLVLCDFEREPESVQFRWLQTSRFAASNRIRDVWGLDDLQISYVQESGEEALLLSDSFDSDQLK